MTISADEQVCKYYFLALQSNRLNIQRFPFNPINSTQSTCDLMPPGALWMKVDENIRGTTCISDAGFLHLPQYFFIVIILITIIVRLKLSVTGFKYK